jgi:hypothetical protein
MNVQAETVMRVIYVRLLISGVLLATALGALEVVGR